MATREQQQQQQARQRKPCCCRSSSSIISRNPAIFLVLFLLQPLLASARFVVEKNSLTVSSPDSLKGTHDSAIGNFGIPQYGGTLSGTVSYSKDNPKACKDFSSPDLFRSHPGGMPMFVMVTRGGMGSQLNWSHISFFVSCVHVCVCLLGLCTSAIIPAMRISTTSRACAGEAPCISLGAVGAS